MDTPKTGRLYIVSTPIGCLEDITLRAIRTLGEVDLVLAEDTRRASILLKHHGITTPRRSYHAHSTESQTSQVVAQLKDGAHIALISDAGTPLISDPGHPLVIAAIDQGCAIEAIPGPSAVITALTVSGMPLPGFSFCGFLPRSGRRRKEALAQIAASPLPSVLYESPRRTHDTLKDLAAVAGDDRPATLCRELTKMHEDIWRGTLADLCKRAEDGVRGEVCLVIGPAVEMAKDESSAPPAIVALISELLALGMSRRDAASRLAEHTSLSKKQAYQTVLSLPNSDGDSETIEG